MDTFRRKFAFALIAVTVVGSAWSSGGSCGPPHHDQEFGGCSSPSATECTAWGLNQGGCYNTSNLNCVQIQGNINSYSYTYSQVNGQCVCTASNPESVVYYDGSDGSGSCDPPTHSVWPSGLG